MYYCISVIVLGLLWLGVETDWLTIRLPYGPARPESYILLLGTTCDLIPLLAMPKQPLLLTTVTRLLLPLGRPPFDAIARPYSWKSSQELHDHMMLCQDYWHCPYSGKCKKTERWTGWKLPARTVKAFGSMLNFNSGCNIARALLLRDIASVHKHNKPTATIKQLPLTFVETVRTGSHREQFGMRGNRKYYDAVNDYKTVFKDCLPGKAWLEAHYKDEIPEPTMELIINGKEFSINGNYKTGMIRDLVKSDRKQIAMAM